MAFWKILAVCILFLCIADALAAFYFHIPFADLLFMEGIFVFASGAYVAAGMANPRSQNWKTLMADSEVYREFLEDQRHKQLSEGIILMVIGAIIIGLSVAIGLSMTGLPR